ncbi:unnamed protein product [Camellia sinensis]
MLSLSSITVGSNLSHQNISLLYSISGPLSPISYLRSLVDLNLSRRFHPPPSRALATDAHIFIHIVLKINSFKILFAKILFHGVIHGRHLRIRLVRLLRKQRLAVAEMRCRRSTTSALVSRAEGSNRDRDRTIVGDEALFLSLGLALQYLVLKCLVLLGFR